MVAVAEAVTLTKADYGFILESLDYTERAVNEYQGYPSYEFKCQRVKEVKELKAKVRALRKLSQ